MRSTAIVAALLASILRPVFAETSEPKERNLITCLTGLKAIAQHIEVKQPDMNPNYIKGLYGSVMLSFGISEPVFDAVEPSDVSDIRHCISIGVSMKKLNLLERVVHGYFPDDPYDELTRCQAAIIAMAPVLDSRIGVERSFLIGKKLGAKVGQAYTTIRYLYGNDDPIQNFIQDARKKLAALARANLKERTQTLRLYANACDWFDVPLQYTTEIIEIMALDDGQ